MSERAEIAVRPPQLQAYYQRRLGESRGRLERALQRVKARAHELTPAARIDASPVRWVAGAFALGLALGWLTAPRR